MTFLKLGDFMREDICTIPVSDVFEVNDGCPICRMYDMLEKERWITLQARQ